MKHMCSCLVALTIIAGKEHHFKQAIAICRMGKGSSHQVIIVYWPPIYNRWLQSSREEAALTLKAREIIFSEHAEPITIIII